MSTNTAINWRGNMIFTREILIPGDRADFYSQVRRGVYLALFRGIYVSSAEWNRLDHHEQYRLRIQSAAEYVDRDIVVSHSSAAALWRLPCVGQWPKRVHVIDPIGFGTRSNVMFVRHGLGTPAVSVEIDGISVTTLARTVVDIAAHSSFGDGVVAMDAALRRDRHPATGIPATRIDRAVLNAELAELHLRQGTARVRAAIEFADGSADRPGESLSRENIKIAGLSPPQLQVELAGASGIVYVVDFWWPEFDLIGEFDGKYKYTDPVFLRERTPERALQDEKFREDDLRAAGHGMSRWGWEVAVSPKRLRAHLTQAGLR